MSKLYLEVYEYFAKMLKKHIDETEQSGDRETQIKLLRLFIELQRVIKS